MERKFSYSTTIELIKAGPDDEKGAMKMKGIASTPSKDRQGDTIDPSGFELSYFLQNGLINWNHEWKKNPLSIIGKPTAAKVNKQNQLEVDYYLFKGHKMAEEVYALSKAMAENGLSLGLSIEGKVLETDPKDKKKIKRAMITDLAVTPHPINQGTTTEIAKSLQLEELIDFDSLGDFEVGTDGEIVRKAMDTSTGEDLIPESLDKDLKMEVYKACTGKVYKSMDELKKGGYVHKGKDGCWYKSAEQEAEMMKGANKKSEKKLFTKSEFVNLLTSQYPGTTPEQAEGVFEFTEIFKSIQMEKLEQEQKRTVSTEDMASALEALAIVKGESTETVAEEAAAQEEEAATETEETIEKGEDTNPFAGLSQEERATKRDELLKSLSDINALEEDREEAAEEEEAIEKGEATETVAEEAAAEEAVEEQEEEEEPAGEQNELVKGISSILAKSIKGMQTESDKKFAAVGTLIKGLQEDLAEIKGEELPQRSVTAQKYVAKPGEIEKGEGGDQLDGNTFSLSTQKHKLATVLTDRFLEKAESSDIDQGLRGDLMALEAGGLITPRLGAFAKSENITIIA